MSVDSPMNDRDPEAYLREYWPDVPVTTEALDPGVRGVTRWASCDKPSVAISAELGPADRRAVLAHEIHHLERGQPDEVDRVADEAHVIKASARWLLPDVPLLRAVIREHGLRAAAEVLGVPARTVATRLKGLSSGEVYLMYE